MSRHQKAWLFTGWLLLAFLTAPFWFLGSVERWGPLAGVLGGMVWLAHGAVALWVFRCPDCGTSLFQSGAIYHPWPRRTCSKCRRDLGQH